MSIKTKLLLCFLSLSVLIFIISIVFYIQLRNLIEPLTPQSIPQSVEQLVDKVDRNDLIQRLLYQQLLVDYSLEHYVFTRRYGGLQEYYVNNAILQQLIESTKQVDPSLGMELEKSFQVTETERNRILQSLKQDAAFSSVKLITNSHYSMVSKKIRDTLNRYYQLTEVPSIENAIVTVKLSAKNAINILQNSLNTTLIIFGVAIIISFLFSISSSHAISRPIHMLRDNIERMGMENLNIPINQDLVNLKGEIGDLARSFVALIEKLRTTTVLRDELLIEVEHRMQFEEKLRQTALQLQESNQALDEFAYIASHDLRAPLRAIDHLSTWIQEDCYSILPEKSRAYFDLLKKRVQRLDALITGILEYSRAGLVTTEKEAVDLNKLLSEVIDNLSPPPYIKIIIENVMPVLNTHKIAITQVFSNLLNNAIKYHDKPIGHIKLGCRVFEKYYQFYVADDGSGIDPRFHKKIFELFQTVKPRNATESTGIGLPIIKKILDRQGGEISLTSVLGQGTTFYFTWPRV